jgi:hypothetical protein
VTEPGSVGPAKPRGGLVEWILRETASRATGSDAFTFSSTARTRGWGPFSDTDFPAQIVSDLIATPGPRDGTIVPTLIAPVSHWTLSTAVIDQISLDILTCVCQGCAPQRSSAVRPRGKVSWQRAPTPVFLSARIRSLEGALGGGLPANRPVGNSIADPPTDLLRTDLERFHGGCAAPHQ